MKKAIFSFFAILTVLGLTQTAGASDFQTPVSTLQNHPNPPHYPPPRPPSFPRYYYFDFTVRDNCLASQENACKNRMVNEANRFCWQESFSECNRWGDRFVNSWMTGYNITPRKLDPANPAAQPVLLRASCRAECEDRW